MIGIVTAMTSELQYLLTQVNIDETRIINKIRFI